MLALVACGGQNQQPPPTTPPATPSGLIAEPGDAAVALSWNANTEANLRGYNVYWGTESESLDSTAFVAAPSTSFTVTGLTNGTSYALAIDAENTAGQKSERTGPVTATPTGEVDPDDPPTVTTTNPSDGQVDVAINQAISVGFSKSMNREETEAAFSAAPEISCTFSWNFTSTTITCTPQENLQSDTSYIVTIGTGAQDAQGNNLASPFSFSFTTGSTELQACVFGESTFGNCVFGP